MKKFILILISGPFVSKNILHSDVFDLLLKEIRDDFVILVPHFRVDYFRKLFRNENRIHVEAVPNGALLSRLSFWYQFMIYNSLPTNTVKIKQYSAFWEEISVRSVPRRTVILLISRLLWWSGKIRLFRTFLASVYLKLAPRYFLELFNKYDFRIVFLPTLLHTTDLHIIDEAHKQGVVVVGSILSWDNLTSKISLPIPPDGVGVPNIGIRQDLVSFSPVRESFLTGYPQYDKYFSKKIDFLSKEEYCRKNGLDPKNKIILYAMAGPKNMPHDFHIISKLKKCIAEGRIKRAQILVSPYPKYSLKHYVEEDLHDGVNVIFGDPVVTNIGGKWEMDKSDVEKLGNLVYHADIVLTVGSTLLIESAILNKPSINIAFDEEAVNYYSSPVRFLDYEHINRLNPYLVNALSFDELEKKIVEILKDPDSFDGRQKRQSIVEDQCGSLKGGASRAMVDFIKSYL